MPETEPEIAVAEAPEKRPSLSWSAMLGKPEFVLDPKDLDRLPLLHEDKGWVRLTSEDWVVKYGKDIRLEEAEAMDYVSKHTSLKTPKVVAAYMIDDITYIVMTAEYGRSFAKFWAESTDDEKAIVLEKLRKGFAEMRAITADYIGGFNRSSCCAGEFDWDSQDRPPQEYGPFEGESAFTEGLIEALHRRRPIDKPPLAEGTDLWCRRYEFHQILRSIKGHKSVLTHGDLNPGHIIVQDNLDVVVIDWGTAGFWPEYWEWYKATWMHLSPFKLLPVFEKFIPPYWIEANIMLQFYEKLLE